MKVSEIDRDKEGELVKGLTSPRPIPDPPPVMKMVLSESFMGRFLCRFK
jgi:hypothetical protein